MSSRAKASEVETRTLLVVDREGKFKVTIPADWKVTFSSFNQGDKFGDGGGAALRIYEAENKQRACFKNVYAFFDTALPIEREVVEESGTVTWVAGPDGYERSEKTTRKKKSGDY